MKSCIKKFLVVAMAIAMLAICIPQSAQAAKKTKNPALEKATVTLAVGEKYTIQLKNISKKAKVKCTYKANNNYVSVSKKGVVKAKNYAGKTTKITVKAKVTEKGKKAKNYTFTQTVKIAKAIALNKKTVTLEAGKTNAIQLVNVPNNATVKCSYYTDNNYVSVSSSGVVTAGQYPGKTTKIIVMATVTEKGKKAKNYTFNQTVNISSASTVKDNETDNNKTDNSKTDNKSLSVGGIGKSGNFKIGLQYVKRMDYLPTALGKVTDIGTGKEVILSFFEAYNDSTSQQKMRFDKVTCYADGVQVGEVEAYIKTQCDGIPEYYYEDITDHGKILSVRQFAVPKGWKELRFYYDSDIVWILQQDDVKTAPYEYKSLFSNSNAKRILTNSNSAIYNDTHKVVFDGARQYSKDILGETRNYILFMFTVTNTGNTALDYNYVGFDMTAYRNNSYLGEPTTMLDEQIDGHNDICEIDSIQSGMSAKVYVAFENRLVGNDYYMIYNEGVFSDDIKGSVYTIVN